MTLNQKPSGRAVSMPRGLTMGALTSLGVTLSLTALFAKLTQQEVIREGQIGYYVMVMLFSGAFLGALVSSGRIKRQRLMVCLLSGGIYFLILMSITALFFGGQYEAVGVTAVLVAGGCVLPVLSGNPSQKRGKKRRRSGANR